MSICRAGGDRGIEGAMKAQKRRIGAGVLGLILGCATLVGAGSCPPSAGAQEELFVTNAVGNSVTVYTRTASGNTAPLRTLQGPATGLNGPTGLVADLAHDELLVANAGNSSVTVYTRTASGNTAPLRTLQGAATGLSGPVDVVVDLVHDELLVANLNGNSVTVYTRTASGNTAPLRTLQGAATALNAPRGLVVDTLNNELGVANVLGTPSRSTPGPPAAARPRCARFRGQLRG